MRPMALKGLMMMNKSTEQSTGSPVLLHNKK